MSGPRVSVVIPAWNGGGRLLQVVTAVLAQRMAEPFELLVVDSGSRDGTLAVLRGSGVRVVDVLPRSFNHGRTRNLGVALARGEIVALLVQDALPDADWLATLVAALDADPEAAGAYSRQVPRPEHPAFVRLPLERWIAGSPAPRRQTVDAAAFESMTPLERQAAVCFDDVASAVRRGVWRRFPFAEMDFAEDLEWSRRVMLAGHAIRYVPESRVVHSHDRGARYELARTYVCHRTLNRLFGTNLIPDRRTLVGAVLATARHNARLVRGAERAGVGRAWRQWRGMAHAAASVLGQYLGPRATPRLDRLLARGV